MTQSIKNNLICYAGRLLGHRTAGWPLRNLVEKYTPGGKSLVRLKRRQGRPFQILIYHRVLPHPDPFTIDAIPVDQFRQHIELLKANFRIIALEQVMEELDNDQLQPRTICITFDDGYRDNYDYALPVLRKYQVPATIFLVSDLIGTRQMLWPDRVLWAIGHATVTKLNFQEANVINADLSDQQIRRQTAIFLLERIKRMTQSERELLIERLLVACQPEKWQPQRTMLNWDEVQNMYTSGIRFGAHTRNHTILTNLTERELQMEIIGSKTKIESMVQAPVVSFAYPNGKHRDFNARCKQVLADAGFACAVTTCNGVNTTRQDRFELHRTGPWDYQPYRFLTRLLLERFTG